MLTTLLTHLGAFIAGGAAVGYVWQRAAVKKALTTIKTDVSAIKAAVDPPK